MTPRRILLLIIAVAALQLAVFFSAMLAATGGVVAAPLDDAYIHFQYAARILAGRPFEYSPTDGYSSGWTSLLWPFLLAPGMLLGLNGERAQIWAMAAGAALIALCAWHTWRWVTRARDARAGLTAALCVLGSGPLLWGTFSGMEVALFACALAATLDHAVRSAQPRARGLPVFWAMVLAGLLALLQGGRAVRARRWASAAAWLLPVGVGSISPIVNFAYTGRATGTGALSKLGPRFVASETPRGPEFFLDAIFEGFGRAFHAGAAPFVLALFFAGVAWAVARDRDERELGPGALVTLWFFPALALYAVAFPVVLQHDRYFQPYLALFLPACALGAAAADAALERVRGRWAPFVSAPLVVLLFLQTASWSRRFGDDAREIAGQHLQMARFIQQRVPEGAVVALNDAGALAYLGGRRTLDLEGIVSPEVLPYALAGEGSLVEYLQRLSRPPDIFVVFPRWYPTLAAAGVWREVARVDLGEAHMSGAALMIAGLPAAAELTALPAPAPDPVDELDVSDLESEHAHEYEPDLPEPLAGRRNVAVRGALGEHSAIDGARRVSGEERFTFATRKGRDHKLVARLFGPTPSTSLAVTVDDKPAGTWELPEVPEGVIAQPGFALPAALVTGERAHIALRPAAPAPAERQVAHYFLYETSAR